MPDDVHVAGLSATSSPAQATTLLGLRQNAAGVAIAGQTDVRCSAMAAAAMAAGTGPASDLERQLRASQTRGCCGLPGALHLAAGRTAQSGQTWQAELAHNLWCVCTAAVANIFVECQDLNTLRIYMRTNNSLDAGSPSRAPHW